MKRFKENDHERNRGCETHAKALEKLKKSLYIKSNFGNPKVVTSPEADGRMARIPKGRNGAPELSDNKLPDNGLPDNGLSDDGLPDDRTG